MERRASQSAEGVLLRPYEDRDAEDSRRIAGSAMDYAHVLDANADAVEVAVLDGRVVGFAYIQVWPWNRVAWLGDVLVEPRSRGMGIGTRLVERMEARARALGCRVLMDHPPARHPAVQFYLSRGFRICGYNDRFYPDSEDPTALFLCKDLVEHGGTREG